MGRAFVGFAIAITIVAAAAAFRPAPIAGDAAAARQLGVVATTLFATSGLLCTYRAVLARTKVVGLIAVVLLGPGAVWTWLALVAGSVNDPRLSAAVVFASSTLSVLLLSRGLRSARWVEVFSGLGSLGLALTVSLVRADPVGAGVQPAVALLSGLAAMTCLYGLLVDIEVSEHRWFQALLGSEQQVRDEVERTEDLLHDLRSGLLSIEAAVGTFDSELARSVRSEAARLRSLTARQHCATRFDLVGSVRDLVETKRAAGADIDLRAPERAMVVGDRAEILSIVENLLSNAERHGRTPIEVDLVLTEATVELAVSDAGAGVRTDEVERLFDRGVSSHPDGHGLGLSVAKKLATRNDAQLVLEGSSSRGTTFSLLVPVTAREPGT